MYKFTTGIIILCIAINQVQCGRFGLNQTKQTSTEANPKAAYTGSGWSAWGIIALILLVILLGMGGYYGILCYPIVCKHERMYDIMDAGSTSSETPTRSTEFEKMGNYSSRSTTPSKSND